MSETEACMPPAIARSVLRRLRSAPTHADGGWPPRAAPAERWSSSSASPARIPWWARPWRFRRAAAGDPCRCDWAHVRAA